jgi:glycosyltransferase involved in cell wall biosynthesis
MKGKALPRLLIVSDTAMSVTGDGEIAFEPVIREIENFQHLFSRIDWIGFRYPGASMYNNARPIEGGKVRMVMLPATGGDTLVAKLGTVLLFPYSFIVVVYYILKHRYIHTRNPSIPGVVAVWFSVFAFRKKFWHKWAGDWNSKTHPVSYRIQRALLRIPRRATVSVNGVWANEPPNIISMENPCFTETELETNNRIASGKKFEEGLRIGFVGGLVKAKGIMEFISALEKLDLRSVQTVEIMGDGPLRAEAEQKAAQLSDKIVFRGFLSRKALNEIYAGLHIVCLPSASEGFPKVIAEAMSFGCVPVVTDISCIGQYIKEGETGFLMPGNTAGDIEAKLNKTLSTSPGTLKNISLRAIELSRLFTYEKYNERIKGIFKI